MTLLDEFAETAMMDTTPVLSLTPGRFKDIAKASRDRDTHADRTMDTVLFRDERHDPHTYDWCYLDVWTNSSHGQGRRGCRMISLRHGQKKHARSL